jgi:hypothetical protein
MQIHNYAIGLQAQTTDDHTRDEVWPDLQKDSVDAALRVATIIQDHREAHGFRVTGTLTWQAAVFALYVFLSHMMPDAQSKNDHPSGSQDIVAGFTECFRCLLASGLGIMLPRAIARMIYRTALSMRVEIPEAVELMLALTADTAWHSSDMQHLESWIPNWNLADTDNSVPATYQMGEVLQKWEAIDLIYGRT